MNCPKCNHDIINSLFYDYHENTRQCGKCKHEFSTEADLRHIAKWKEQKATRPDKIEEIKMVWDSPNFKTHNQRIVYLLRHCKKVEYGYTLREFAHAIYPEKMNIKLREDGGWGEYYALKNIRQIFRRFRHDVTNHEVLLISRFLKVNGIGRWYYYNTIDDEEGFEEHKSRQAKILLGMNKIHNKMLDILEMSHEERERKSEELSEKLKLKYAKRLENKKKRKAKK